MSTALPTGEDRGECLRREIVEEALRWIDTPFVHQASICGVGTDCVGLIRGVAWNLGLADVHESNPKYRDLLSYPRRSDSRRMRRDLDRFMVNVPVAEARAGDVLWFRIGGEDRHVGIITRRGYVVHASHKGGRTMNDGRVLEHRVDPKWKIIRAWSFPGVGP